ncbi:MAG: glycosylase [Clostridia bacterium]|nr:glycosylase [Clostridia bacterium]
MVSDKKMREVFNRLKTPVKLGAVIKDDGILYDSPSIFFKDGLWYMMYIGISANDEDRGYETFLASSPDLLHWKKLGRILTRTKTGWDGNQVDGQFVLTDISFGGSYSIKPFDGKYWCAYIGGAKPGYEPDPLLIGYACTDDPTVPSEWKRLEQPILSPYDSDARDFENATIYRTFIFEDTTNTLGHRFLMYYNAKSGTIRKEQIGMCVSDDFYTWKRYLPSPVISNLDFKDNCISGDPQVIRMEDLGLWVIAYFRFDPPLGAFDTFACSENLTDWTRWQGEPLIKPGDGYDNLYAHKPHIISHNGKVYHFYCACNTKGERFIALAVSE